MATSRRPKRSPLTISRSTSRTITSDRLTTEIVLLFRGNKVCVEGRRWSVDGDEKFFYSGNLGSAADLWSALEVAASEGLIDLPTMDEVVRMLGKEDADWAHALATLSQEEI